MLKKILFLCLLFISVCAYAEREYIAQFNAAILVDKKASLLITEDIIVYATNDRIIHGISRTLPVKYKDSYGINRYTFYKIQQILVDGHRTPYHTQYENDQFAIYIGDTNSYVTHGIHTYQIKYRVAKAINFLKDADELYWNITGNQWDFPILSASAVITLPKTANILNGTGYTGVLGAKYHDVLVKKIANNQILFKTTKILASGEGLTVALAFQKGVAEPPPFWEELKDQLFYNFNQYIMMGIALILLFYFIVVWLKYGRDPQPGTIIPRFKPPDQLSPASMRFIKRMSFDTKTFTAAIVNMAEKGWLKIVNNDEEFTLIKESAGKVPLANEEIDGFTSLFNYGSPLSVSNDNEKIFSDAKEEIKNALKKSYQGLYFVTNYQYFFVAILLSLLAFLAAIFSADNKGEAFFTIISLASWTAGCFLLTYQAWLRIQDAYHEISIKKIFRAFVSSFFALLFLLGEVIIILAFTQTFPLFIIPTLFFIILIDVIFFFFLKTHTIQGRKILDEIEGFKLYLTTTETDRLNRLQPPKKTLTLFTQYLPYAIALDVENQWGEQFNELIESAEETEDMKYHPAWYISNTPGSRSSPAVFTSLFYDGFSRALSTASVSLSSSASGGGGSSGGGGGGGGGGGW